MDFAIRGLAVARDIPITRDLLRTPCCSIAGSRDCCRDCPGARAIVDIGPRGFGNLRDSRNRSAGRRDRRARARARSVDRLRADAERREHAHRGKRAGHARAERAPTSGWADPVEHARMLHDERRTGDYLAAIAAAVRPDDVVLDIGTGSGVLAVAAAVPARGTCTRSRPATSPRSPSGCSRRTGSQDRVTIVPGWSRQIELPEPADLLVAEVIGNEPLEEEILETTLDARRRLLGAGRPPDPAPRSRCWPAPCCCPSPRSGSGRSDVRRSSAGGTCTASTSTRCSTPRSPARPTPSPRAKWSPPGRRSVRRSS